MYVLWLQLWLHGYAVFVISIAVSRVVLHRPSAVFLPEHELLAHRQTPLNAVRMNSEFAADV